MRRLLVQFFALGTLVATMAVAVCWWWVHKPMVLRAPAVDLAVEPGTRPRAVVQAVVAAGVDVHPELLFLWFRLSGQSRQIKAGSYELTQGVSPMALLAKLTRGEESLKAVVLVEGWTFRQIRQALLKEEHLTQKTRGLSDDSIMQLLGRPGQMAEGLFFPDTYTFSKGSTDLAVLERALHAMDRQIESAWQQRSPNSVLQTPAQALTLASIVEKETGRASDRAMISSVFHNRLRIGMPLQTDPTVIYGMGESFDGNLRKNDLQTDTPWNTYTRRGLPPTPIASPGKAALLAAVQPASSRALYFVARGDGSSQFSATLEEHNRAVNQYQRAPARNPP